MYLAHPGHIDHIKRNNSGAIYQLIDTHGPISRIELSKLSQLAPASITKITRELIDAHLIKETQYQESNSRGRPAIGLVTNNEGWQFLSLRLGRGYIAMALHELGGGILIEDSTTLDEIEQAPLLARLEQEVTRFLSEHVRDIDRITSLAVSLPGLVDPKRGVVVQMPHYRVKDMPLGDVLHQSTGLPVFIGNDTAAWTLAEKLFGNSKGVANSILIAVHYGVGAGIVLDNIVLISERGNIGELGHIQMVEEGMPCHCGNHGCLETVVSHTAMLNQIEQDLAAGVETSLRERSISIRNLCIAAVEGDAYATRLIESLGQHLGRAIAMMVNVFHPEKILFGGEYNLAKSILYPAMLSAIHSQSIPVYTENLELQETQFFHEATMPGAALVKQAMYNGSLLMKVIEG
ncbi:Protein mlc [Vibrio stylophorae]|uniref:Protein mlc n=1 Tax=Vibrio stylophorae TaxID=659351 RepID=A0ABM8ZSX8_9VIBR|nr:ROK family protein [Vibrio stylophorae]CAH0533420.1 Protein mlc [Vibrio stylophorae]